MDWGEILLTLLLDLVITVFFYLLVSVIFCLRKKSLAKKQIKTIVIINGIVVWLIFQILTLELTGEASSGAAVFLWSFVAYKLLMRYCLVDDEDEEESPAEPYIAVENTPVEDSKTIDPEKNAEISLSPKGEIPKKYGNYNISGSEVRFNSEDSPSAIPEQTTVSSESVPPRLSRYCSRCGGEVDADTAKCTKCGKQYLNKLTKIGIAIIAAAVLIIIVIICIAAGTKNGNANNNTTNSNNGSNTSMSVAEQTIAMRIAEMVSGKDSEYYDYIQEAYTIARTGNETYGKGQGAVVNYINHLPIEYGESIIMFRLIYQSDSTYCREIVEYLNGRNDISYDDTVYILTNLGFMVSSNGTVSWD